MSDCQTCKKLYEELSRKYEDTSKTLERCVILLKIFEDGLERMEDTIDNRVK